MGEKGGGECGKKKGRGDCGRCAWEGRRGRGLVFTYYWSAPPQRCLG